MEVGLVCVVSRDDDVRSQVDLMARQLLPVEDATFIGIDTPFMSLRMRVAPWIDKPDAHDPDTGTGLLLLGRAWKGIRTLDAESLLREFLRDGDTALTALGGSFAVVTWDPREGSLRIATDRLGTKKIYAYAASDATLLLATELRALANHPLVPRVVDDVAVGQFLVTSHLIDQRSLIRDVHVLPPGTIARVDDGAPSIRRYWTPCVAPSRNQSLDACADELAEALSEAVRARSTTHPLLLPLSGGLDSRSVAAFIPPDVARQSTAYSFGHSHCCDVRYGRRMANALGASFTFLPLPEYFFRHYLAPVLALCDGEVSIEALPMYCLLGIGQAGQTMLTGFLGDVLSGGHLLGAELGSDPQVGRDVIWRRKYQGKGFSEAALEQVLLPERYEAMRGRTRDTMMSALAEADGESLDEKALIVELHHRQSRYISYFSRLLSSRYRVETPFLDVDVLDRFLAMPLAHRQQQRAYRRMLVRHAPRVAAVPENKTCKPVTFADRHDIPPAAARGSAGLPLGVRWRLHAARKKLDDLLITVSGGWLGPHDRSAYAHHDESIRRVDPGWFHARLLDNPLAADWFHVPALRNMLDEHMKGAQDHSTRINNVIAFLAWRESTGI